MENVPIVTMAILEKRKASEDMKKHFKRFSGGLNEVPLDEFFQSYIKAQNESEAIWLISQPEFVKYFIQLIDDRRVSWFVRRAVEVAGEQGHYESVKALLEGGVKLGSDGTKQVLQGAAKGGDVRIAKLLLENGAELNENHGNALHVALLHKRDDMVDFLLSKGIKKKIASGPETLSAFKIFEKHGLLSEAVLLNALDHVCRFGDDLDLVKTILDCSIDLNCAKELNFLAMAARRGNFSVVQLLLEKGCDVEMFGIEALSAAGRGEAEMAQKDKMFIAGDGKYPEVVILLCHKIAEVYQKKMSGKK